MPEDSVAIEDRESIFADAKRFRWLKKQLQAAYDGNGIEFVDSRFSIFCSMIYGRKDERMLEAHIRFIDERDEPVNIDAAIDAAMDDIAEKIE